MGSELLEPGRVETNTTWLAERLDGVGCPVVARGVVGDDAAAIAASVACAARRADVVLLTGGLGPTEDDRTREGLAAALGRPLVDDAARAAAIRALLEDHGRTWSAAQARQARRPRDAAWIENPLGTAPGIDARDGGVAFYALPGVPPEMRRMFDEHVLPRLERGAASTRLRRTLHVVGPTEASMDERLRDLYGAPGLEVSTLIGREGLEVRLRVSAADAATAAARLAEIDAAMAARLGADLVGRDDATLAGVVGNALLRRGATVATAESCTAGLLAATLTAEPGSSAWFRGGFVAYADDLKRDLVGVDAASLAGHGAVSEVVARGLAEGARERCSADFGVGVTGIAGPGGGSAEKPVGLVHFALAGPAGTEHWRARHLGDRDLVRRRAVVSALDRLRRRLAAGSG